MSLMLVMLAVSMSLAMTYAFLQTQTVAVQVGSNLQRRDLALQAAQTGISLALQDLQGASWAGVTNTLSGTLVSNSDGTTSYGVQYLPYSAPAGQTTPSDGAFRVLIQSTGTWQAAGGSGQSAQRQVQAVARLAPRILGRAAVAGDLAAADDVADNPADYDTISTYTLYANQSGTSLSIDPADRIEGPLWIYDSIDLFTSPGWNNSVRSQFLASVGSRFVTTSQGQTQYWYPHPLSGPITFYKNPKGSLRNDLSSLGTTWSRPQVQLNMPGLNPSSWQQYQLYSGGFVYNAVPVGPQLQSVTLRPSPTNPAGIFYSSGSVTLGDDTVIQGTLVANGQVTFSGDRVFVGAYNWLDANGQPIATGSNTWPRLPAVVAQSVTFGTNTQTMIEGPVIAANTVSGAGGTYEFLSLGSFALTGSATCQPTQQPWSTVQLSWLTSFVGLTGGGAYSIWLTQGTTGNWYPIISSDPVHGQLQIMGEVSISTPTSFKILPTRKRYVDIRGPVTAGTVSIACPQEWILGSFNWQTLFTRWQMNYPLPNFSAWLENGVDFLLIWSPPYTQWTYGLNLEPTFNLRNPSTTTFLWQPPLFQSYQGTGTNAPYSGYRWKVLSVQEEP